MLQVEGIGEILSREIGERWAEAAMVGWLRLNAERKGQERVQVCFPPGSGCRVQGAGCRVQGAGRRFKGAVFRVQGAGCRVQGSG